MAENIKLLTVCPYCGERKEFTLPLEKVEQWKSGGHIQNVFPELSADDRERLVSSICPKCWDEITKEEGDE